MNSGRDSGARLFFGGRRGGGGGVYREGKARKTNADREGGNVAWRDIREGCCVWMICRGEVRGEGCGNAVSMLTLLCNYGFQGVRWVKFG